ncbi:DNA adenine methylase [Sphingomonas sabuli]|nr:DNA adenine methylase [Sphingomonas sabuli]
MGTKRQLSPEISQIVRQCRSGVFLDAFAGMASVAQAVGQERQIWVNDLQVFANLVGKVLFCSDETLPVSEKAFRNLEATFEHKRLELSKDNSTQIFEEERALSCGNLESLQHLFKTSTKRENCREIATDGRYDLFISRYAGSYFSTKQAIELDSARFALDRAVSERVITTDQFDRLLVALGMAMNKCSTSTGHFAQPLAPSVKNLVRITKERERSVWRTMKIELSSINPIGSASWRRNNRVFKQDAVDLVKQLNESNIRPSVIYADPPYTDDQYSRFYHMYETLVLYDYPACTGRGRYRDRRARSVFNLASGAMNAVSNLIQLTAQLEADLILSYPEKGLINDPRGTIGNLFRKHYGREAAVLELSHKHSTFGGSTGQANMPATEFVFRMAA